MTTLIHPDRRFLFAHPAHFLALGFGSGLMRPAPGTWGTLVALPLAWLWFRFGGSPFLLLLLCLPFFGLGAWAARVTSRSLGVHDHGCIVWDEVVGMLLVLALIPGDWLSWCMGFVLFRLFDIFKPWPIRWFDDHVHGGAGIMIDDVVAAFLTVLVFLAVHRWLPYLF